MSNTSTFRKAISAWLKRKPEAAAELLKQSLPLSPAQNRIWKRVVETR